MYNNFCFIGNAENYHTSSRNVVNGFPGQQSSFTLSSASSEYLMSIPSSCKTCKSLDVEIHTTKFFYRYYLSFIKKFIAKVITKFLNWGGVWGH